MKSLPQSFRIRPFKFIDIAQAVAYIRRIAYDQVKFYIFVETIGSWTEIEGIFIDKIAAFYWATSEITELFLQQILSFVKIENYDLF